MPQDINIISNAGTETFDALFRKYYAPMVIYAMRLMGNQEDAEDAVQEVFSKLFTKWKTMKIDKQSHGLLFTMLHNKILDIKKINCRHISTSISNIKGEEFSSVVEDSIFEMETYTRLYEEINLLPCKNREVMRMKMKGMNDHDIAEQLGLSINTVRNHVKNGVSALRNKFDDKAFTLVVLTSFSCHI